MFTTLRDDFNDNDLNGATWPGNYGVTETGGRAVIASSSGWPTLKSASVYTLVGSQVYARWTPAPRVAGSVSAYSTIDVTSPGAPVGSRLNVTYDPPSGVIRFGNDIDWWDPEGGSTQYNAATMRWFRIREAAGRVFFETSPDGLAWTVQHSVVLPAWAARSDLSVGFQCYQDSGTAQGYVDSVNVGLAPPVRMKLASGLWAASSVKRY